ncbi:MAG: hypothetical protein HYZ90_04155 [Candidatus Omnitrophica bacterium]|nr:hypothetical protein [Candidatus Omnitrophota bacterium]
MKQIHTPSTPRARRLMAAHPGLMALALGLFLSAQAAALSEEEKPKTFWERHGKVEDEAAQALVSLESAPPQPVEQTPLTLESLRIPTQHGSIKQSYASREPLIIHIQDAHANYEAQKHLSGILEHLIRAHGLALVLVEGGSRNDSLSYMRSYAPLEKRKQVAEEFLKSGKISGENYLDLTTDYPFTVYGVEKPELYDQNMESFLNVEKVQPDALSAMRGFQEAVAKLKDRLYPQAVRELELRELEVEEGRVPLARHYQSLAEEAKKLKVSFQEKETPNLFKFLKASDLEGKINFKEVEAQRTRFLEALTQTLPKPEMDRLLKQSLELKSGLISPATFYGHLQTYFRQEQAAEYPMLSQYVEYLGLFEAIDHAALFTEVEGVSERVKRAYFKNKDQEELALASKDVGVLNDLLELKLTPDSYNYYAAHKREFKPDKWADTLRALGAKQNPPLTFSLVPGPLNAAMPAMSSFYEVARERDVAMVENAVKRIEEFKVPAAVLIAGGFHTPAFERLFKERKVSYAVVAPKVGKVTAADTEKYHRVLKETYVPMSEPYRKKLGVPGTPDLRASNEMVESEEAVQGPRSEIRPLAFAEAVAEE